MASRMETRQYCSEFVENSVRVGYIPREATELAEYCVQEFEMPRSEPTFQSLFVEAQRFQGLKGLAMLYELDAGPYVALSVYTLTESDMQNTTHWQDLVQRMYQFSHEVRERSHDVIVKLYNAGLIGMNDTSMVNEIVQGTVINPRQVNGRAYTCRVSDVLLARVDPFITPMFNR